MEDFRIDDDDIIRYMTDSEILDYEDIKTELDIKKEGEIYNIQFFVDFDIQ